MSVQQIESEIVKLTPAEIKQLTAWLGEFASAGQAKSRPRVGEITSARVVCAEDCFAPLTDEEMLEWGFA